MLTDKEMYKGFSKEEVDAIRKEVANRWGEKELKETEDRIRQLGTTGWDDAKQKGEEVNQLLADLSEFSPSDKKVQEAIALHHRHLNLFYEVTKERYLGLGKMYTVDDRFRVHYDQYKIGLADFIYEAILVYCKNGMSTK